MLLALILEMNILRYVNVNVNFIFYNLINKYVYNIHVEYLGKFT